MAAQSFTVNFSCNKGDIKNPNYEGIKFYTDDGAVTQLNGNHDSLIFKGPDITDAGAIAKLKELAPNSFSGGSLAKGGKSKKKGRRRRRRGRKTQHKR